MNANQPDPIVPLSIQKLSPDLYNYLRRLSRSHEAVYRRTGGGSDYITDTRENLIAGESRISVHARHTRSMEGQSRAFSETARKTLDNKELAATKAALITAEKKIRRLEQQLKKLTALIETN